MPGELRRVPGAVTTRAVELLLYAPLLLVPAAFGLLLKWTILELTGYRQQFVGLDKLSLYRADAVVFLMVAPLLSLALRRILRPRLGSIVVGVAAIVATVLFCMQFQAVSVLGRPSSVTTMIEGVRYVWGRPSEMVRYASPWETGGLLALLLAMGTWTLRLARGADCLRDAALGRPLAVRAAHALVFAGVVVGALPFALRGAAPAHCRCTSSMLSWAAESLVDVRGGAPVGRDPVDPRELHRTYLELSNTPAPSPSPYTATARDFDVVFVVFETAPAALFDLQGSLEDLPGWRRLRETSFVGLSHYSTAPLSNRAYFSIFTSWYPLNAPRDYIQLNRSASTPGLMRRLASAGYRIVPVFNSRIAGVTPLDDERLQSYGFASVFSPVGMSDERWQARWAADRSAQASLTRELEAAAAGGHRYAAAFFPQVGHGPWVDVTDGAAQGSDVLERGRALMRLQDQVLVDLVATLTRLHRLDRTIIVVTGDHGLRTRREDPMLQPGRLDERAYHVPLLVSVPGVLSAPVPIDTVTSHIDIVPSVLDLLGMEPGRALEQGLPLWDPGLRQRRTFFWGKWFIGADGYAENGRFHMVQQDTREAFVADRLAFRDADRVEAGPDAERTLNLVDRMERLQQVWTAQLTQPRANPTDVQADAAGRPPARQ